MTTLILDTSTKYLFVSIVRDGIEIVNHIQEGKNNHSDYLMNIIMDSCARHQLKVGDFDNIIVGRGPGSYTGLRISMVVAKMFAWTKNIPLYTVSSLEVIGSGYFIEDGYYRISSTAKKEYVYGKVVQVENKNVTTVQEEVFLSEDAFHDLTNAMDAISINSSNYRFSGLNIVNLSLTLVEDIHSVAPNYMRKEFS